MARGLGARVRRLGVGGVIGAGLLVLAAPAAGAATPATADLSIAIAGPSTAAAGSTVTYVLTVTNNGPDASPGSVVLDALPAGFTNVKTSTPGCSVTGRLVSCTEGALSAHGTSVVTITATVPSGFTTAATSRAAVVGRIVDTSFGNNLASQVTSPAPKGQLFDVPVALAVTVGLGAVGVAIGSKRNRASSPSVEV